MADKRNAYKLAWWLWSENHSMEEAEQFISKAEDMLKANPRKSVTELCSEMLFGKPATENTASR